MGLLHTVTELEVNQMIKHYNNHSGTAIAHRPGLGREGREKKMGTKDREPPFPQNN